MFVTHTFRCYLEVVDAVVADLDQKKSQMFNLKPAGVFTV